MEKYEPALSLPVMNEDAYEQKILDFLLKIPVIWGVSRPPSRTGLARAASADCFTPG
jgi:hypothetical protein